MEQINDNPAAYMVNKLLGYVYVNYKKQILFS